MKDKKIKLITNLIILTLSLLLFVSCDAGEAAENSDVSSETPQLTLSAEEAKALLERDKLITEIFICNSLCDKTVTKAERMNLSEDDPFYSFSAIEALLDSTYVSESGDKSFFLSYPQNHEPAVTDSEGKTTVFCHPGSNYTDFAELSTVTVSDTEDNGKKLISVMTATGKKVQLKAVCVNGAWLLEKGIYRSNPPEKSEYDLHFQTGNAGSLSNFSGNILVIEFFISDDEVQITQAEEEQFHNNIKSAVDMLAAQASVYGEVPEIDYESAYFDHERVLGNHVLDFDLMFAETGFGTLKAFAEANYDVAAYDNYFFVVCLKKDMELSVGRYDNTDETDFYIAERVLITPKNTSAEIYKAILQMLGAYSYDQGVLDEYTEALYNLYFPNDVFNSEDISLAVMSPVTAYNCGITKELESLYHIFISEK